MNETPERTDEEWLSAFADGELSPGDAARLRERLAAEPALARRLAQMRDADRALREAFAGLDDEALPPGVLELLTEPAEVDGPDAGKVVPLRPRGPRSFAQAPVAIAASVALVAGFLAHAFLDRGERPGAALDEAGVVADGSGLDRLLDRSPGAEPQAVDGGDGEIVLTFADSAGDWCRQFLIRRTDGTLQGLACRRGDDWQMDTAVFTRPAAPADAGGQYRQAAGETPPALESAVRAALGSRAVLDPEAESRLISNSWKKSSE